MEASPYEVRRATLDDLPELIRLWELERFAVADLEKRVTEFQIVISPERKIVAALGMQIAHNQGKLHSEVIAQFDQAVPLRAMLWERLISVARNHGLTRVWTFASPFWEEKGFKQPDSTSLSKLPPIFGTPQEPWLIVPLRDDNPAVVNIEQQFAEYQRAEREQLERLTQSAQKVKWAVLLVLLAMLLAMAIWGGMVLLKSRRGM